MKRAAVALFLVWFAACASEPPPKARRVKRPKKTEVVEKEPDKSATPEVKAAEIATALGVDAGAIVWSGEKKVFAIAVPTQEPNDTQGTEIAVYRDDGERIGAFAPPTPGPIAELAFLGEDRVVYLVPPRPPPVAKKARGKHKGGKAIAAKKKAAKAKTKAQARGKTRGGKLAVAEKNKPPPLPTVTYAIQPLDTAAAPIVCLGRRFVFSPKHDHIAWVVGEPGAEYVAADGVQVYPRKGTTTVQGAPAWSRDGVSLALVQTTPEPLLVVLVEFDNPNGDNTWPLPPEAVDPALGVFWAGPGTVVVGPELTKPVFAASFKREPTPPVAADLPSDKAKGGDEKAEDDEETQKETEKDKEKEKDKDDK